MGSTVGVAYYVFILCSEIRTNLSYGHAPPNPEAPEVSLRDRWPSDFSSLFLPIAPPSLEKPLIPVTEHRVLEYYNCTISRRSTLYSSCYNILVRHKCCFKNCYAQTTLV